MIKKHQKFSIYAIYKRTSPKQLLKKTFEPSKENPNIEESLHVLIAAVKIFLLP